MGRVLALSLWSSPPFVSLRKRSTLLSFRLCNANGFGSGVLGIILGVRAFQGQNQPNRSELTKASSILTVASW